METTRPRVLLLMLMSVLWAMSFEVASSAMAFKHLTTRGGAAILLIQGEFEAGDDPRLLIAEVNQAPPKFVALYSQGGDRAFAIQLGRTIRALGLPTLQVKGSTCLSTCILAFLGGAARYAEDGSIVLDRTAFFTAAELQQSPVPDTSLTGPVKQYLAQAGVSPSLVDITLSTPPGQNRGLGLVEMARLQMITAQPNSSENGAESSVAPVQTDTDAGAMAVFSEFERTWSGSQADAVAFLQNIYADNLSYYGKALSREDVLKEKLTFADRWPTRIYAVRTVRRTCFVRKSVPFSVSLIGSPAAPREKRAHQGESIFS